MEIIEAGFHVEVVTAIAQGVELGDMGIGDGVALAIGGAQMLAPSIVGILGNRVQGIDLALACVFHKLNDIPLQVQNIIICHWFCCTIGIDQRKGFSALVVNEVENLRGFACSNRFPDDLAVLRNIVMLSRGRGDGHTLVGSIHKLITIDAEHLRPDSVTITRSDGCVPAEADTQCCSKYRIFLTEFINITEFFIDKSEHFTPRQRAAPLSFRPVC